MQCSPFSINSEGLRDAIYERIVDEEGSILLGGRRYRLRATDSLEGITEDDLLEALRTVDVPCVVTLKADSEPNCGDDTIRAVNLTRPTECPVKRTYVEAIVTRVSKKYPDAAHIAFTNFLGGPCEEEKINWAVVAGGSNGWTVLNSPEKAILLSVARAKKKRGSIAPGCAVRLARLSSRTDLNGEVGIAISFNTSSSRWNVRLRSGDGKKIRPSNLDVVGDFPPVMIFWGDARWSRTQLLGEIARHWGMCRADVSDIISRPSDRWSNLEGRMVFAPVTEMTEEYVREAQGEMMLMQSSRMRRLPESEVLEGDASELALVEAATE